VGYQVYLWYGTSVYWYIKTRVESGPDLSPSVVKIAVKPIHSQFEVI